MNHLDLSAAGLLIGTVVVFVVGFVVGRLERSGVLRRWD